MSLSSKPKERRTAQNNSLAGAFFSNQQELELNQT
jgi:hypothetical protein